MRRFATLLIGMAALFWVAGCNADKVAGYYHSEAGDCLWIKRDGQVLWCPPLKGGEEFVHFCILSYNRKTHEASFIFHSASPYIGTSVKFSEDLRVIQVDWRRIDGKAVEDRGREYHKDRGR